MSDTHKGLCLPDFDIFLDPNVQEAEVHANIVSESSEIETSIEAAVGVDDLSLSDSATADIEATYESMKGSQEYLNTAVIVAEVRTVKRWVDNVGGGDGEYGDQPLCSSEDDAPQNLEDFVNLCGTEYVDTDEMGIYVYMMADLSGYETEEMEELGAELGFDGGPANASFEGTMESLANSKFDQLQWVTQAQGDLAVPIPEADPDDDWVTTFAEQWNDWLNDTKDAVAQAIADDEPFSPAFGTVLDYTTAEYGAASLETHCGYEFEFGGLECISAHHAESALLTGVNSPVLRKTSEIEWKLDNAGRVDWPAPEARDQLEDFYDFVHGNSDDGIVGCITKVENSINECSDLLTDLVDDGVDRADMEQQLCESGACSVPDECTEDAIMTEYNNLPEAEVFADGVTGTPEVFYKDQTFFSGNALKPVDNWICIPSGVSGRFAGGGEAIGVQMSEPGSGGSWYPVLDSGRTEATEHVSAYYTCIPRGDFQDTTGNPLDSGDFIPESPRYETANHNEPLDPSVAFPLSFVSGAMNGFGEHVRTIPDVYNYYDSTPDPIIRAYSSTDGGDPGYLEVGTYHLGLANAANNEMELWTDSGGQTWKNLRISPSEFKSHQDDVQLAPMSDAFCYLSAVRGKFHGAGEQVRVRPGNTHWVLDMKTYQDLEATAQCVLYDQSG